MKAESDKYKDGHLSIQEIFDVPLLVVDTPCERSICPQSPQIVAPALLGNMPLRNTPMAR